MRQKGILRRMLLKYSSLNDIESYCFDLGIPYDELGNSDNKNVKVMRLIEFICQREMQNEFRDYLMQYRHEVKIYWGAVNWEKLCDEEDTLYLDNGTFSIEIPGSLESFNKKEVRMQLAHIFMVEPEDIIMSSVRNGSIVLDLISQSTLLNTVKNHQSPFKDRKDLDVITTDFSYTNLQRAYLNRADLSRSYLKGAYLYRADLRRVNLNLANLTNAKLIRSNLYFADLNRADLTRANLTGADLTGAILTGANLAGAILTWAILDSDFDTALVRYDENTIWPWGKGPKYEKALA